MRNIRKTLAARVNMVFDRDALLWHIEYRNDMPGLSCVFTDVKAAPDGSLLEAEEERIKSVVKTSEEIFGHTTRQVIEEEIEQVFDSKFWIEHLEARHLVG